jgi:hypothetical protein
MLYKKKKGLVSVSNPPSNPVKVNLVLSFPIFSNAPKDGDKINKK